MERGPLMAIAGAALAGILVVAGFSVFARDDGAADARQAASGAIEAEAPPAVVSSREAGAWAEARAANSKAAYEVYLAAFPDGAFAKDAEAALESLEAPKAAAPRPQAARAEATPAPARRVNVAAACQAYVDRTLSEPSRAGRAVGGAAAGCGVGALAGGDDGRNCAVGAVVGAAAGAISAESRERRRLQEVETCIARGGPPG